MNPDPLSKVGPAAWTMLRALEKCDDERVVEAAIRNGLVETLVEDPWPTKP